MCSGFGGRFPGSRSSEYINNDNHPSHSRTEEVQRVVGSINTSSLDNPDEDGVSEYEYE